MSARPYKPFVAHNIGNSISCYTLERMLNEIGNNSLNEKVTKNITRYFYTVRKVSLSIHDPEIRKIVGEMMLQQAKTAPITIVGVHDKMGYVIRNVKYAYIKDMMISDSPMHYQRRLRPAELSSGYWCEEFEPEFEEAICHDKPLQYPQHTWDYNPNYLEDEARARGETPTPLPTPLPIAKIKAI